MKFLLQWNARSVGSPADCETVQRLTSELFNVRRLPASMRVYQFVKRVGDCGGYSVVECDDLAELQRFLSRFAALNFEVAPVLGLADAEVAERAAIEWRFAQNRAAGS